MEKGNLFRFPSPLTLAEIQTNKRKFSVTIPKQEIFRVDNIFKHQEYAVPRHWLPNDDLTVVDIGANVGLFALYTHLRYQKPTIHCFEPVPSTVQLLKHNLKGLDGIHLHGYGLSNCSHPCVMPLHPHNTGENSLKYVSPLSSEAIEVDIRDAKTVFDQLDLKKIDLLKIDTEGSETEILQSLHPVLNRIGIILLEYHAENDRRQIDRLLESFHLFEARVAKPGLGILKYIRTGHLE